MILPDYLYLVLALAGSAYAFRSLVETYLMVREYLDLKNQDPKNEGLQALMR